MLCPLCKTNLKETILNNTAVDYCPDCLGLWFAEDELRQAKDEKDKELNWLDVNLWKDKKKFKFAYGLKLCPVCHLPLYETAYNRSKIKVDLCNLCQGIWLDRGEFEAVIQYLKKKADYELTHNYAKNLLSEAFEVFAGPEKFREELADLLTVLKMLTYKFSSQRPEIPPQTPVQK